MFSEQAPGIIDQLINAGMSREQAEIIGGGIGMCTQKLKHNGPIDLNYNWPDNATDDHALLDLDAWPPPAVALRVRRGRAIFSDGIEVVDWGDTLSPMYNFRFHNVSGAIIPAYAVMRISGRETIGGQEFLRCAKHNTTFRRLSAVNGPTPVPINGQGICSTIGGCKVLYDTAATPTLEQEWGAKSNEWKLFPNRPGFFVFGPYGTPTGRMIAQQEIVKNVIGVAGTTITPGSAQGIVIYVGSSGSEASSELGLTARDYLLKTATQITSGKKVIVEWINGIAYVSEAECE